MKEDTDRDVEMKNINGDGTGEDKTSSTNNNGHVKKPIKDDAVDVSLQSHIKEVEDDLVTNPVIQANKRAKLRDGKEKVFLGGGHAGAADLAKTIEEEQIGLYKEVHGDQADEPLIDEEDVEVEAASDDEPEDNVKRRRGRKRIVDSDYSLDEDGQEKESLDSDGDVPMDELEPEQVDFEDSKKKKKKSQGSQNFTRRHRTEVDEAHLSGDEQQETVFIDNLPNDEQSIRSKLNEVRKIIKDLER